MTSFRWGTTVALSVPVLPPLSLSHPRAALSVEWALPPLCPLERRCCTVPVVVVGEVAVEAWPAITLPPTCWPPTRPPTPTLKCHSRPFRAASPWISRFPRPASAAVWSSAAAAVRSTWTTELPSTYLHAWFWILFSSHWCHKTLIYFHTLTLTFTLYCQLSFACHT